MEFVEGREGRLLPSQLYQHARCHWGGTIYCVFYFESAPTYSSAIAIFRGLTPMLLKCLITLVCKLPEDGDCGQLCLNT